MSDEPVSLTPIWVSLAVQIILVLERVAHYFFLFTSRITRSDCSGHVCGCCAGAFGWTAADEPPPPDEDGDE